MLLQTFKGRILALSLGTTILSVLIFGYGLSGIYRDHMYKCLNRSLSFLNKTLTTEFDPQNYSLSMQKEMYQHPQLQNVLKGGLISNIEIDIYQTQPISNTARIYQYKKLPDGSYFSISSSTEKIDEEVLKMIEDRWIFFLFGFLVTSTIIYLLVRLLFRPINELVRHCLTCEDPDQEPSHVSGGAEIATLRDAIATLQSRISRLQKEKHESIKALTHELKTPLAQLRLRIDLANESDKWTQESASEAKKEIDEISQKITTILKSPKISTKNSTIYLYESLTHLITELEPLWKHRELAFEIHIAKETQFILPLEAFERVLRILIENSINHSLKGATIEIEEREAEIKIKNPISTDKNKIIDSTGKGLEIARTLCEYYGWELSATTKDSEYEINLKVEKMK